MSASAHDDRYESYLMEAWKSEVSKFDRTILSLAGGALALSITFIRDIAGDSPQVVALVAFGWLALIVSMGLIVWSFLISKKAIEQRWDHDHALGDELSKKAWRLSIVGGVCLAVGIILIAVFALWNLVD